MAYHTTMLKLSQLKMYMQQSTNLLSIEKD